MFKWCRQLPKCQMEASPLAHFGKMTLRMIVYQKGLCASERASCHDMFLLFLIALMKKRGEKQQGEAVAAETRAAVKDVSGIPSHIIQYLEITQTGTRCSV